MCPMWFKKLNQIEHIEKNIIVTLVNISPKYSLLCASMCPMWFKKYSI